MLKKSLLSLFAILIVAAVWQRELIYYGYKQGMGQLSIIYNAQPIDQYLNNKDYPDSLKQKLLLVEEVRKFAYQNLSINPTNNYTTMFDQQGQPLMWVVTACDSFSFTPKTWRFPVVGEVPYKGYFDIEMAKEEVDRLKGSYDVSVRNPGGWSTLGWFTDPILSEMLNKSDEQLVELIIHELSHSTIFVKDSVAFNENLASFIGYHGTQLFLKHKYGESNSYLEDYLHQEEDYKRLVGHFIGGAKKLDSLYQSFVSRDINYDKKKLAKDSLIGEIMESLDTVQFTDVERFKFSFEEIPNNTYFMSYLRYRSKQDDFEYVLQTKFGGDIVQFIDHYKLEYPFL